MTTLSGRVTVHGGDKAAATATVELRNAGGDIVDQVQVDADGRYRFHLSPGVWSLNVWDSYGHRGRAGVNLSDADENVDIMLAEPEGGH